MNAPAPPHPHAGAAAVRPARAHGGVGLAWALPAALIGWVAATALQLQQADLEDIFIQIMEKGAL